MKGTSKMLLILFIDLSGGFMSVFSLQKFVGQISYFAKSPFKSSSYFSAEMSFSYRFEEVIYVNTMYESFVKYIFCK